MGRLPEHSCVSLSLLAAPHQPHYHLSVVVALEWCLALPSAVFAAASSWENDSGARIGVDTAGMGAGRRHLVGKDTIRWRRRCSCVHDLGLRRKMLELKKHMGWSRMAQQLTC